MSTDKIPKVYSHNMHMFTGYVSYSSAFYVTLADFLLKCRICSLVSNKLEFAGANFACWTYLSWILYILMVYSSRVVLAYNDSVRKGRFPDVIGVGTTGTLWSQDTFWPRGVMQVFGMTSPVSHW